MLIPEFRNSNGFRWSSTFPQNIGTVRLGFDNCLAMASLSSSTADALQAVPSRVRFQPHHVNRSVSGQCKKRIVLCNRTSNSVPFVLQAPSTDQFQCLLLDNASGLHTEILVQPGNSKTNDAPTSGCVPPESSIALMIKFTPPPTGTEGYLFHSFQDVLYCHLTAGHLVEIRLTAVCDPASGVETKAGTKHTHVYPTTLQLPQPPPVSTFPTLATTPARLTAENLSFTSNWNAVEEETGQGERKTQPSYQQEPRERPSERPRGDRPRGDRPRGDRPPSSPLRSPESKRHSLSRSYEATDQKHDLGGFSEDGRGVLTEGGGFEINTSVGDMEELNFYRNIVSGGSGGGTGGGSGGGSGNSGNRGNSGNSGNSGGTIGSGSGSSSGGGGARNSYPTLSSTPMITPIEPPPPLRRQPSNLINRVDTVEDARSIVQRMRARHSSTMSNVGQRVVNDANPSQVGQKFATMNVSTLHSSSSSSSSSFPRTNPAHSSTMQPRSSNHYSNHNSNSNSNSNSNGISLAEFNSIVTNSRETRRLQRAPSQHSTTLLPSGLNIEQEEVSFYKNHMMMDTKRKDALRQGRAGGSNNAYRDLVDGKEPSFLLVSFL